MLELIETLHQACKQLKLQKGQSFIDLCAEIQDFVSNIYDFVQDILEPESAPINSLKILYKTLYEVAQGKVAVKRLKQLIYEIEGQVKALQPDQIEVAFFCYKASMSDCFESVYFSAKSDPKCDAYFIPIPYYDRNPDGSFGTMHVEGIGHYPDTYELADWEKYDVAARRPDVIFIMNPYDGDNHVTSVHPNFYSKRLKDFTDCLIFIEYGISIWMYRDATLAKDEIKQNPILLPGYLYSDFHIVYSKETACYLQTSFEVHHSYINSHHIDPKILGDKVLALGSPKFDKVVSSKRSDFLLPTDWKEKIQDKKVILYNTSLGELLNSTASQFQEYGNFKAEDCIYFKKIRAILNILYKRNDVVLWWRPHPLFESTLKSMRPKLYQEYQDIIQEFFRKDCGIYDTTDELHRAICWSDAMISDESSLLWLYLATEKPFYIPSISKALKNPVYQDDLNFHYPIQRQIEHMIYAQSAKAENYNTCIWWEIFTDEDIPTNTHFNHFLERFLHYVIFVDDYPENDEYIRLKRQIFQRFVVHSNGTAGKKIYEFCKQNALSCGDKLEFLSNASRTLKNG